MIRPTRDVRRVPADMLMWLLTTFPTAIAAFTDAFVSQYNGAK